VPSWRTADRCRPLAVARENVGHGNFGDVIQDAMVMVPGVSDREVAEKAREFTARFYEEVDSPPAEVADRHRSCRCRGHRVLRKKLRGVIAFHEQCRRGPPLVAMTDRLRHKLGLSATRPPAQRPEPHRPPTSLPAAPNSQR
jgi:hypothetical protein